MSNDSKAKLNGNPDEQYILVPRSSISLGKTSLKKADEPPKIPDKDEKSIVPVVAPQAKILKQMKLQMAKGAKGKGGLSQVRTRLFINNSTVSAAGGTIAVAIPIIIANDSEVSSYWVSLYDEAKLHGGEFHFRVQDAGNSLSRFGAIGFDPTDNTTPGTLSEVLEHSRSMLFAAGFNPGNSTFSYTVQPCATTRNGLYVFKWKVKNNEAVESQNRTYTGAWHSIQTTNPDTDGCLKLFVELAATTTCTVEYITMLDVSFRSRT
jgi:hypothetical protein